MFSRVSAAVLHPKVQPFAQKVYRCSYVISVLNKQTIKSKEQRGSRKQEAGNGLIKYGFISC